MAHWKWKETKQEPGTDGPGNMLGCCLISFHFLWAILCLQALHFELNGIVALCLITSKAKFSGSFGGALSPRKLLQSLSASRLVIIPHLREVIGMAPARRNTSSWKEEAEKETGPSD